MRTDRWQRMTGAPMADDDDGDQEKAVERRALSARVVHEALRSEGASELERPWNALAWSGLAAGISMGLSLIAQGLLRAHLPDTNWRPLVVSAGYSVGFIAVTLGRQQLFTETTLTACLPLLHEQTARIFRRVVQLWVVVLISNLLGGALFAWTATHASAFDPALRNAFSAIARDALHYGTRDAFVRAILGGWIIALMVWLLPSADSSRPFIVLLMTSLLAASGLTHIIAGSLEAFYAIFVGDYALTTYLWRYAAPVLTGNAIGGIVFVAMLNHAQVVAEKA